MTSQHRESNRQSLPLSEHQYFSKGGLGLIRDGIYIVLKSTEKNELKLPGGKHWVGSEITKPEKVVVVDGVVTSDLAAISDKTLEKVIIVSFEGDRVYFYDFANLVGGYYLRIH